MKKNQLLNFIFVLFTFITDRATKILIINFAEINGEVNIGLTSFLNLNLIWNEGIAFGLFSFDNSFGYNLITIIISVIIIIIMIMLINAEKLSRFALILILGGALGNLFDRLYYSAVPDFIEFYFKSFHWFIFNVADIFITLGVFCLIYVELKNKDNLDEKNI